MRTYASLLAIIFLFVSCSKEENTIQHKVDTAINPVEGGSMNPPSGAFDSGEEINLKATPAEGYAFKNWSGAVNSSENPLKVIIDSDKKITAIFERADSDGDGVPDGSDQCPGTPGGEMVDGSGCIPGSRTFVPDDNFEKRLIDMGYDNNLDDYVLTSNIVVVENLILVGEFEIIDLTGLEAFESLKSLELIAVNDNSFSMNTSNYPNLTKLTLDLSRLKSLEINENSILEDLEFIDDSGLETLIVSNSNSLKRISLHLGDIRDVFVNGNSALTTFFTFDGSLGDVEITDNDALSSITFIDIDNIDSLDYSNNSVLEKFRMNPFFDVNFPLDFSMAPTLREIIVGRGFGKVLSIDVTRNKILEKLDVADSGLEALNVSCENSALKELDVTLNPMLSCVIVSQEQLGAIPLGWVKDSNTVYALECPN